MEIKGSAVVSIRDYVKHTHFDKYDEWLKSLPSGSRMIFEEAIDATGWYECQEAAVEPTRKIADIFFDSDREKGAWEAGRFSAEKALTGIYKIFVKAASPSFIIQRASRIFSTYYRPCVMSTIKKGGKNVTVSLSSEDEVLPVIEFRIAGWCEKGLELSGAKNTVVKTERKEEDGKHVVDFIMSWD